MTYGTVGKACKQKGVDHLIFATEDVSRANVSGMISMMRRVVIAIVSWLKRFVPITTEIRGKRLAVNMIMDETIGQVVVGRELWCR